MSRIAYVNGRYIAHRAARVHIEDRGYQFADGIYEVVAVRRGHLVDEGPHLDRLDRSLGEMRMAAPMGRAALRHAMREVIRRNRVADGIVYLQVTRGVAPRGHAFPKGAAPALVITAKRLAPNYAQMEKGIAIVTLPDIRWKRRDIKTVNLTANVLAKQQALDAGAYDAWLVDEAGMVNEGTASNAWIVTRAKELVTHAPDHSILNGITRLAVKRLAETKGYRFVERPFSKSEALAAEEAFVTGTTSWVTPVVAIDGKPIGGGTAGPLTRALQRLYEAHADEP
ncbi:MAG: D-amino-acid transaminase [Candidatus Odyssella sp.]|nr:D-amino-acid transaminase [Candidatus Odyssella sp.]